MLLGNCEGARARVCVYSLSWWGLNVLAFFYLNRLTCFSIQSLLQSHTHTHTHTHAHTQNESGRRLQYCRPLLLPLKMWGFFFPSLPDFLGGVHCPLCPKALFIFPSLILFLPHSLSTKSEREKSFTWTRRATGTTWPQREQITRQKREMSRCICIAVFCALFRSLAV